MFNIPVTILYRTDERIIPLAASVPIDDIIRVSPIDSETNIGVESYSHPDLVPRCVIRLSSGELVVSDPYQQLLVYLDAYRAFDPDFEREAPPVRSGPKLSLIQGGNCDISEASIPA